MESRNLVPGAALVSTEYQTLGGATDTPFQRDSAVYGMMPGWATMQAVMSGTDYLRNHCRTYLPQEPREDDGAYLVRVNRSVLSPYTQRLIENATGMVLRRPIRVEGDPYWTEFSKNVNGLGSSINEYCRQALVKAMQYGHGAILVDFPADEGALTLRDELQSNRRPYFVNIDAPQIWGWRQERPIPSAPLTQVRINRWVTKADGEFGEKREEQMLVIRPGRFEIWNADGRVDASDYSLDAIPLVPIYTNRIGMLTSTPPLIDIASINLCHYQRQADLIHALHLAAMPTLVLEGWDNGPDETSLGVNYAIAMDPGNKAYYIQCDSGSFQAQANELLQLEGQMTNLGVTKLLGQKFVAESADAKRIDQAQANSVLSIISMELESALQNAYDFAAQYLNIAPPKITLDRDFDFYRLLGQDVSVVGQLASNGLITDKTFLEILKQGEILPDNVDLNTELEAVRSQKEQQDGMLDTRTVGPGMEGLRGSSERRSEGEGVSNSARAKEEASESDGST